MKPYYYVLGPQENKQNLMHESLGNAQKEAERLANKHTGIAFEILECVGFSHASNADTFWMDGVNYPHQPTNKNDENNNQCR